tara:strand:+ start:5259 stop:5786 length:528 start_codon:yes stop_codon:yes gene_type:complete
LKTNNTNDQCFIQATENFIVMKANSITKHSLFYRSVYTEIIINAKKEKVWQTLTDFNEMPKWSRTMQRIEGELLENSEVILHYFFQGRVKYFNVKLIEVEKGTQFGWSEKHFPMAKDKHIFRVEALNENTSRFIQTDQIKGISALFIGYAITRYMLKSFAGFNESLKEIAEGHNQ